MFQYLCLLIPVIFFVTFILMPDTPHYYLSKGSRQRAINSLRYLRGKSAEGVAEELDEIQASVLESMSHRAVFTDVFKGRANLIGKEIRTEIWLRNFTSFRFLSSIDDRRWTNLLSKLFGNRRCIVLQRNNIQQSWKLSRLGSRDNSYRRRDACFFLCFTFLRRQFGSKGFVAHFSRWNGCEFDFNGNLLFLRLSWHDGRLRLAACYIFSQLHFVLLRRLRPTSLHHARGNVCTWNKIDGELICSVGLLDRRLRCH